MGVKLRSVLCMGCLLVAASGFAQEIDLPKNVELLLPRQPIGVGWVIPPTESKYAAPEIFDVDKKGEPWFGLKGKTIVAPFGNALLAVDEPVQQFVWTQDGAFLLSNGRSLGYLIGVKIKDDPSRVTKTAFKPVLELPGRNYRLFPAGAGGLFLAGQNPKTKKYEVIYVHMKDREASVTKILESESPVNHVAGRVNDAWVAIGRVVARIDLRTDTLVPEFAHPTEPIREFVHSGAGFFYVTSSGLGFFKKGIQYQFMRGPNLRIRLQNDNLFVLLDNGLLRFDGISRFGSIPRPQQSIP